MGKNRMWLLNFGIILFFCNGIPTCYGADIEVDEVALRKKIGQLIIMGFSGTKPEDEGVRAVYDLLRKEELGGVIFYGHNITNPEQFAALTSFLHKANPKALMGIDQEGGLVQRLTPKKGFTLDTPSAQDIVALYPDPEQAHPVYGEMAKLLKSLNLNLNFGPVVDLNDPVCPSPAIGKYKRSYGNDPKLVAAYAGVFVEEHRKNSVLTSLKHLPGHGYSTTDTHNELTDTTKTADPEKEMTPYKILMERGLVDLIMTAHIVNTNYDSEGFPATLSPKMLPSLLRSSGYDGVVISDALNMKAISAHYTIEETVRHALAATCDLLLFSNNPLSSARVVDCKELVKNIEQQVKSGNISLKRIEESYKRVAALKERLT